MNYISFAFFTSVFLTLLGGGVFANKISWIADAIEAALERFHAEPLEVYIVCYNEPEQEIEDMVARFCDKH